jgi:hypothetical protein
MLVLIFVFVIPLFSWVPDSKTSAQELGECSYEARAVTESDIDRVAGALAVAATSPTFSDGDVLPRLRALIDTLQERLDANDSWLFLDCGSTQHILERIPSGGGNLIFINPSLDFPPNLEGDIGSYDIDWVLTVLGPNYTAVRSGVTNERRYTATNPDVAINWLEDGSTGGGDDGGGGGGSRPPVSGDCSYELRVPTQQDIDRIIRLVYTAGADDPGSNTRSRLQELANWLADKKANEEEWLFLRNGDQLYILDFRDSEGSVNSTGLLKFINPQNLNDTIRAQPPDYRSVLLNGGAVCTSENNDDALAWIEDNAYLVDDSFSKPSCVSKLDYMGAWLACIFLNIVDGFTNTAIDAVNSMLAVEPEEVNDDGLKQAWSYFRNIASLLLVVIGLAMIIGQGISKE